MLFTIADKLPNELTPANKKTPIMQMHGTQDEVVVMSAGKVAHDLLLDAGYLAKWKTYAMPHSVVLEQLEDISAWIQAVLK